MILDIKETPELHKVLEPFNFHNRPCDPLELATNLAETMLNKNGLGLAANQCGLSYRVFVIRSEPMLACFNPVITAFGPDQVLLDEGCLSFPFLYIKIKRPDLVRVRYQDPNGETIVERFVGMTSRIFQHELDHLNGITFQSHANRIHLARALNQQKHHLRNTKRNR